MNSLSKILIFIAFALSLHCVFCYETTAPFIEVNVNIEYTAPNSSPENKEFDNRFNIEECCNTHSLDIEKPFLSIDLKAYSIRKYLPVITHDSIWIPPEFS